MTLRKQFEKLDQINPTAVNELFQQAVQFSRQPMPSFRLHNKLHNVKITGTYTLQDIFSESACAAINQFVEAGLPALTRGVHDQLKNETTTSNLDKVSNLDRVSEWAGKLQKLIPALEVLKNTFPELMINGQSVKDICNHFSGIKHQPWNIPVQQPECKVSPDLDKNAKDIIEIERRKAVLNLYFQYICKKLGMGKTPGEKEFKDVDERLTRAAFTQDKDVQLLTKYGIVRDLLRNLNDNTLTPQGRLTAYDRTFTLESQKTLGDRRDGTGMTIFKLLISAVLAPIAGVGVYLGFRFFYSTARSEGSKTLKALEFGLKSTAKRQKI